MANFNSERSILEVGLRSLRSVPPAKSTVSRNDLNKALNAIPSFRPAYGKALPLALEIIRGSSVWLDRFDSGLVAPSFLINLEDVFEAYVRNVLNARFKEGGIDITVLDGNKKRWMGKLLNN